MPHAPETPATVLLLILLSASGTATVAHSALAGRQLHAVIAGVVACLALAAAYAYSKRTPRRAILASSALALQVLSLVLAFAGQSLAMVLVNVGGSLAGLLALVTRLVELPAEWSRAHA